MFTAAGEYFFHGVCPAMECPQYCRVEMRGQGAPIPIENDVNGLCMLEGRLIGTFAAVA